MDKSVRGRRIVSVAAVVALVAVVGLLAAACGSSDSPSATGTVSADTIVGAGATFPAPIYQKWAQQYEQANGLKINYQPIGSGGSADQLKLTGELLAKIYNGDVTKWNDPAIAAVNQGVSLPSTKITVVHRSDGSGTTWIFTHYLTAVAPSVWTAGADKEVAWPVGVGGKGNDGVAASVQQLTGSIGYVEYAYAKQNSMATVQLENADGTFVSAGLDSFKAAASQADWSTPGYAVLLVDLPGAKTWPIVGATFILVQKEQQDAQRAQTMLQYFDWCYANGAAAAESLDYVPIPASGYDLVEKDAWPTIAVSGTPVWPM
jgi:phosphate transport system substrate-binding protein